MLCMQHMFWKHTELTALLQNGRVEFAWIMRHKDPLQCGLGAVLRWLFYRFEFCEEQQYPDFTSRQSW